MKKLFTITIHILFTGLYFSAQWCRPCREFTPKLAAFYNEYTKTNKNFEIVNVSMDKSEQEWRGFYGNMPWLSIPFKEQDKRVRITFIAINLYLPLNY